MSSWNTPSFNWTLTIAETPTKNFPWWSYLLYDGQGDCWKPNLVMVHKVDGLLGDWVAPPVVSKYLISETHGSVTLKVGCILAAPDGSLNKILKNKQEMEIELTLLIKLGPSLAWRAFCIAACSSLEYCSRPNLTNWSDGLLLWFLHELVVVIVSHLFVLSENNIVLYIIYMLHISSVYKRRKITWKFESAA